MTLDDMSRLFKIYAKEKGIDAEECFGHYLFNQELDECFDYCVNKCAKNHKCHAHQIVRRGGRIAGSLRPIILEMGLIDKDDPRMTEP